MSPTLRMWIEIIFDLAYLASIWVVVVLMFVKMKNVALENRRVAELLRAMFLLLAAGDTGHVGLRTVAYLTGGMETTFPLWGTQVGMVGLGMLATAVTVTLFYMLMVYVWHYRFHKPIDWFAGLLLAAGVVRLVIMAMPGNDWYATTAPEPLGLVRNIPLMIQGIGIVILILSDSFRAKDVAFQWVGWMIVVSFAFYIPVILFAGQIPLLGMLMIPKTCAYLAAAFIAYHFLFNQKPAKAPVKA